MNKLDLQYQNLLKDILENGTTKADRTGTGTISVFGRQLRHDFRDGFPLLTTKRMPFKTIVTELLWFIRGDTNIKFLVDNGCHIWDGDAYKRYLEYTILGVNNGLDRIKGHLDNCLVEFEDSYEHFTNPSFQYGFRPHTKEEFINKIKTDDEFVKKWGELGRVYGKQWRDWESRPNIKSWKNEKRETIDDLGQHYYYETKSYDQITNLINDLKTNPDSRRLMVSAWNVGELDQMVLPPCHYGFQVYTRELSVDERLDLASKKYKVFDPFDFYVGDHKEIDELYPVPKRAISLMWNQRSVDTFLGLPFNIASYGLLLEIIAKAVNMVPDELIGNLGDVHLYSNHVEQAKEQIGREMSDEEIIEYHYKNTDTKTKWKKSDNKYYYYSEENNMWAEHSTSDIYFGMGPHCPKRTREPYPLPTLKHIKTESFFKSLSEDVSLVTHLDNTDFEMENYQSHPTIKAPLSN